MIKKVLIFLLLLISILLQAAFAQGNSGNNNNNENKKEYQIEIRNSKKINTKTYQFDIYIKTSDLINLSAYQCSFIFNQKILSNGILKYQYITGSSQLKNKPYTWQIIGAYNNKQLIFASGPGFEQTQEEKRIGTFTLSSTKDFIKNEKINLKWNFDGNITTIIMGTDSKNITNWFYFNPKN